MLVMLATPLGILLAGINIEQFGLVPALLGLAMLFVLAGLNVVVNPAFGELDVASGRRATC